MGRGTAIQKNQYNWLIMKDDCPRLYMTLKAIQKEYPLISKNHLYDNIVKAKKCTLEHIRLPLDYQQLRIQKVCIRRKIDPQELKAKHQCPCGGRFTTTNALKHSKTMMHRDWLAEQDLSDSSSEL